MHASPRSANHTDHMLSQGRAVDDGLGLDNGSRLEHLVHTDETADDLADYSSPQTDDIRGYLLPAMRVACRMARFSA